ncbi:hypothetical protein PGIGA_G00120190 [Pangasianodon gigas]|uniref:Uncharacterized protein n=1 Tax=Pangasianodon gigas TaxID=30993 RepID=A0ACC5XH16_PANGG|nr:hypothetical protein [Pangasianodon gigas]
MDQVKVQLFLLIILALGITAPMAEGCSCVHSHFQDIFCHSQIVIRAKIIGQKIISPSHNLYGEKLIEYKIKLIKVSCSCPTEFMGYLWREGKVVIELCGIAERWDNLLLAQKKNLKYRYQKGCECKISTCSRPRCRAISANECAWFPFSSQTLQGVCMKRTNGTCNWYIDKSDSHTQHNVGQNGMGETSSVLQVREPKPTETLQ